MMDFAAARRNMVDGQIRTFDVTDRAVLAAMTELPRELFVPASLQALAYLDQSLPLDGPGQRQDPRFTLAPMVLARLLQALQIEDGCASLVVAGGLGYSAAVLARLGADVTMLESRSDLLAGARERLGAAGVGERVRLVEGPLEDGVPGQTFEAILIEGAVERRPTKLLDQLADGGRLACMSVENGPGEALLFVRSGPALGFRSLFNAAAPVLAAFRRDPAFVF